MRYSYKTKEVCAGEISFDFDGEVVTNVNFSSGCPGNLTAISALVDGLTPAQIIKKCEGITCGPRSTSCTDQLTKALKEVIEQL